jgi:heptosyltransferase-2
MTPVLRLLRSHWPEARIEVVTKAEFADLLRVNPCVDALHLFDDKEGIGPLLRRLRRVRYDLALDLHRTLRSRLLFLGVRASQKLAYRKRPIRRALLVRFKWRTAGAKPVPELYAAPLRRLGIAAPLPPTELHLTADARAAADAFLATALGQGDAGRPLLAVAPGARWATKRWPVERFAAVSAELARARSAVVVVLGSAEDRPLAAHMLRHAGPRVVDATGKLSLLETAALLERCQLFVGNDSGLSHMAAALRVPLVSIFGPTVKEFGFYPFTTNARVVSVELGCRPCTTKGSDRCPLGHHHCMLRISTGDVGAAARELLRPT